MSNMFGGTKINKPQKDNSKISKMMGGLAESYKGQASGDKLKKQATNGMGSKVMGGKGMDNGMGGKGKGMGMGKGIGQGLTMPILKKNGVKKGTKKSGFKGFKI